MKVKNIMFSGFAAAILMGVAAEANAAPTAKVVASKGYVDAVAGPLGDLSTEAKHNLVKAINEVNANKQAKFIDGEDVSTTTGFISSVTQTGGAVTAGTTAFDREFNDTTKTHENTAPTTKAVADVIDSLDYESTADAANNANQLTNGYAVSYVSQVDGKVTIGAKEYNQVVNATSAEGIVGRNAPSTAAVWNAIQASGYDDTALAGRVTANEGDITSLQNDKEDKSNKTDTINEESTSTQYPSAAAVYSAIQASEYDDTALAGRVTTAENDIDALQQEVGAIPVMPAACQAPGVVCVLSSEDGSYLWSVLAQPYTYTSGTQTDVSTGLTAQEQVINTNVNPHF